MAEAGLGQRVEEGDYSGLVGVMGHLLAVKERQNSTDAMFEPLKQTIALLKVYEQELPDVVYKQLEVRTDVQMSEHVLFRLFFELRQNHFAYLLSLTYFLLAIHHLSLLPSLFVLPFLYLPILASICRCYQKSGTMSKSRQC